MAPRPLTGGPHHRHAFGVVDVAYSATRVSAWKAP